MVRQILKTRTEVGLKTICLILEINRSSYYSWLKRPDSQRVEANIQLSEKIKTVHRASKGTYGAPRITAELKAQGFRCSQNRVAKLMKKQGIFGCAIKSFRPISTTQSKHNYPVLPRLFETGNQAKLPTAPNQVWVGDITYISTKEGWLYLAVMMDVFSRKIVGYSIADHLKSEMTWEAIKKGVCQQKEALMPGKPALIAHSDRGVQYASYYYQEKLTLLGISQSMSRKANCYDNAFAESFFHTLKVELIYRYEFTTRRQAQLAIENYIDDWYNSKRRHSGIGYKTPCEYEKMALIA